MPRKKKSETVPREMYEEMRAMYDALLTKYDALKLAGASKPEAERTRLRPPSPTLPCRWPTRRPDRTAASWITT